jgi:hypothetical protein
LVAQKLAAAQQLINSKEADLAAARGQEEDFQQQKALLLQAEDECMALQQRVEAAQQHKAGLQELVSAGASSSHSDNLMQQHEAHKRLEAASRVKEEQQQEILKQVTDFLHQLEQQHAEASKAVAAWRKQQKVEEQAVATVPTAGVASTLSAAQEQLQKVSRSVQLLQQEVLQAQAQHAAYLQASKNHQMQALEALLLPNGSHPGSSGAKGGAQGGPQGNSSTSSTSALEGVAPLQSCFRVKNAESQEVQGLSNALAAICGLGSLDTLVVPSSEQVGQILQAVNRQQGRPRGWTHGKLRLWPLDSLSCKDRTTLQQAAQQKLGKDKVILPLQLLEYPPEVHVAMVRAFGGLVIAADDQVADTLIKQFGLSSVTPQGTLSHKGSMTGGWMGAASGGPVARWKQKMQQDASALKLEALQHQLQHQLQEQRRLEVIVQELQQQVEDAEAWQEKLLQLQQDAEEQARELAAGQRQYEAAKLLHVQLKQEHKSCLERMQRFEESMGSGATKGHSKQQNVEGSAMQQLQQDLEAAASQEADLESKLESCQEKVCGVCVGGCQECMFVAKARTV